MKNTNKLEIVLLTVGFVGIAICYTLQDYKTGLYIATSGLLYFGITKNL